MLNREQKYNRYLVAVLCGLIIISRIIWPEIKFDEVSVIVFAIGILVILIPDIGDLIKRIRRVRKGDIEIEFESLIAELADKTDKVEKEIEVPSENPFTIDISASEIRNRIAKLPINPREKLVTLAAEIEAATLDLAEYYQIPRAHSFISPMMVASELAKRELLPKETPDLIKGFWSVRNQAVHAKNFEITQEHLYELLDLGIRILRLLSIRRSFVEFARRQMKSRDSADIIVGANILSQQGEPADKQLLQDVLKREGLSEEAKETLERAIRDLEKKRKAKE